MSAAGSRLMRERARSQQQHPKKGDEEERDKMWFNAYGLTFMSTTLIHVKWNKRGLYTIAMFGYVCPCVVLYTLGGNIIC